MYSRFKTRESSLTAPNYKFGNFKSEEKSLFRFSKTFFEKNYKKTSYLKNYKNLTSHNWRQGLQSPENTLIAPNYRVEKFKQ